MAKDISPHVEITDGQKGFEAYCTPSNSLHPAGYHNLSDRTTTTTISPRSQRLTYTMPVDINAQRLNAETTTWDAASHENATASSGLTASATTTGHPSPASASCGSSDSSSHPPANPLAAESNVPSVEGRYHAYASKAPGPFDRPEDETAWALRFVRKLADDDAEYPNPVAKQFLELFEPKNDGGTGDTKPLTVKIWPSAIQHQQEQGGTTAYTFHDGSYHNSYNGSKREVPNIQRMWNANKHVADARTGSTGSTRVCLSTKNGFTITQIRTPQISNHHTDTLCQLVHSDPLGPEHPCLSRVTMITALMPKEPREGEQGLEDLFPDGHHLKRVQYESDQRMPDPSLHGFVPGYQYAKVWLERDPPSRANVLEEQGLAEHRKNISAEEVSSV